MTEQTSSRASRSPRYPGYSIRWAIEQGMKLLEAEKLHPAPPDVVAQALNYKDANSGAAGRAIAAIRAFGIVQKTTNGWLQVSPDVQRYKLTPSKEDKATYLNQWLRKPALYSRLLEKHGVNLPSDRVLVFELVAEHGFTESAAQQAVRVLRDSVEYVRKSIGALDAAGSENETTEDETEDEEQLRLDWGSSTREKPESGRHPPSGPASVAPSRGLRYPIRLTEGRMAWIEVPDLLYKADKARLQAQLSVIGTADEDDEPLELNG